MITKMTGRLTRVLADEARVEIGPFEYQVMVPETVRRQLQLRTGQDVTFYVSEYYEGNQAGSKLVPRKVGFLHEAELDFFDLFCTVDKVGVKKALKAMARPVKEIADAVSRQDVRWLSTLPGIGPTTAEQMVTTLRKKIARFVALATPAEGAGAAADETAPKKGKKKPVEPSAPPLPTADANVAEDVYQALMVMGLPPAEARAKLDGLLTSGRTFATADEAFKLIFGSK